MNRPLPADVPIECLLPTLFVTLSYFMAGLPLSIGHFTATLAIVLAVSLTIQAMGVLLGVTITSFRLAQVTTRLT